MGGERNSEIRTSVVPWKGTEDNGTLLPGEVGKVPGLERDLGAWLCGCLFKREISNAGRWSRARKYPFCSGMRKGSRVTPSGSCWPCSCPQGTELVKESLDSCHGRGWDRSRMLCNANESQTSTKVCFITATKRNTPSFYNLNIHKRENILLLFP